MTDENDIMENMVGQVGIWVDISVALMMSMSWRIL